MLGSATNSMIDTQIVNIYYNTDWKSDTNDPRYAGHWTEDLSS